MKGKDAKLIKTTTVKNRKLTGAYSNVYLKVYKMAKPELKHLFPKSLTSTLQDTLHESVASFLSCSDSGEKQGYPIINQFQI